jgi:hypothetical protein
VSERKKFTAFFENYANGGGVRGSYSTKLHSAAENRDPSSSVVIGTHPGNSKPDRRFMA